MSAMTQRTNYKNDLNLMGQNQIGKITVKW